MILHDLIFSNKASQRIARHSLFWIFWWVYFASTYYYYIQVGLQKITFGQISAILFFKTFILLLLLMPICYVFLYFIIPKFLFARRYSSLIVATIVLFGTLLFLGRFTFEKAFPVIDRAFNFQLPSNQVVAWWTSVNSLLLNAPKVIAAASVVKLFKRWYMLQKEKERLENEKLVTDIQLLKAQMRPGFLFSSLEQIYHHSRIKSPRAADMLIMLSDLLSYLLYECESPTVSVGAELEMIKEYIAIESVRFENAIETEISANCDADVQIAPLILLPFVENSLRLCGTVSDHPWLSVVVSVENNLLSMQLMHSANEIPGGSDLLPKEIEDIKKRLQFIYPVNHELKMYTEQEISVVILKINLQPNAGQAQIFYPGGETGIPKTTRYASI